MPARRDFALTNMGNTASTTVELRPRIVYFAPTARRHYFTKAAACKAEARARIKRKYPAERGDWTSGDPGWCWRELPRAETLLRRYARLFFRSCQCAKTSP